MTPLRSLFAALALLAGLPACDTITDAEFIASYEQAYCESYALCATDEMTRTVNEFECLEYLRYQVYPTRNNECKFQPDAAESCIADLPSAGCTGADPTIPLICEDVFSKCQLPRIPAPGEAADAAGATPAG